MVIAVAVLVVLVVCLGAAWLIWRRGGDEVHSVEGYQHTLTTLQSMRARSGGTVRVLGTPRAGSPGPPPGSPGPPAPPETTEGATLHPVAPDPEAAEGVEAGEAATAEPETAEDGARGAEPEPGTPLLEGGGTRLDPPPEDLVFEDLSLGPPIGGQVPARRSQARAITAMNHRPRHLTVPIVAGVAVVVVVVVVAVVGTSSHHHPPAARGTAASGTAATHHATRQGAHHLVTHHKTHAPVTPTTAPPTQLLPTVVQPPTASPTAATYTPPAASYTVTVVVPAGESWVQVQSATGATLFGQTLPAGQQRSFPLTGGSTLILGAAGSTRTTIDSLPVVYPANYRSPLTLTLTPAGTTPPAGAPPVTTTTG